MISRGLRRFVHTNSVLCHPTSKSLLAKLRKKTGYTFSNCKKALELHDNDLAKAEKWLQEQAQAMGWAKAAKLQDRATMQGLVAVMVDRHHGALVEISCETDFVARNKQFQGLAETVAAAVLKKCVGLEGAERTRKALLDTEALKALAAMDGKSLADHTALAIGSLAENIGLRRALCISVDDDLKLAGYAHPASSEMSTVSFGKYGAILAYKTASDDVSLGTQLCQHIIGMNPTKIGNVTTDQPSEIVDDETAMVYQEYLLDPNIDVQHVLADTQTELFDFARFEVGEQLEIGQELDNVETCG